MGKTKAKLTKNFDSSIDLNRPLVGKSANSGKNCFVLRKEFNISCRNELATYACDVTMQP